MECIVKGKILDVDNEPWEFEGKKGVKYYATIKDESKKLITLKLEEKDFLEFQALVGEYVEVKANIYVNGVFSLKFKEF